MIKKLKNMIFKTGFNRQPITKKPYHRLLNDYSRVHTTPCSVVSSKIIISDWLNHIVTSRYTI
jgi:hypothetical protein